MAASDHTRNRLSLILNHAYCHGSSARRARRARLRAAVIGTVTTAMIVTAAPAAPARQSEARPGAASGPDTSDPRDGWRPNSERAADEGDPGVWDRLFGDDDQNKVRDDKDFNQSALKDLDPGRITLDRDRNRRLAQARYQVSGEAANVRIASPRTVRATGADLAWSAYEGKGLLEYEVHRSMAASFEPTAETLVAPVDRNSLVFQDRSAAPAAADDADGRAYHYLVAVRTTGGELLTGPVRAVELPPLGQTKTLKGEKLVAAPAAAVDTYHLPFTPARVVPGETVTVEATLTNTTATVWKKGERVLSYRWTFDGKDVTNLLNKDATALPRDLAPGETVTFDAELKAPVLVDPLDKRLTFGLEWDLRDKATGDWLSETDGCRRPRSR